MSDTMHDRELCWIIGRVEKVADMETEVGDSLCYQTGKVPENLTTAEWMEFVEAVHCYVETREPDPDIPDPEEALEQNSDPEDVFNIEDTNE